MKKQKKKKKKKRREGENTSCPDIEHHVGAVGREGL